jgi:hypothetical protein
VDPGGIWLPSAGKCPVVQQWHGARETSAGKSAPREIVDRGRIGHSRQEDHPPSKSGTAQGTRTSETSQIGYYTENSEGTNVQEETLKGPGMQNWNKGPRRQTAAIFLEGEDNH